TARAASRTASWAPSPGMRRTPSRGCAPCSLSPPGRRSVDAAELLVVSRDDRLRAHADARALLRRRLEPGADRGGLGRGRAAAARGDPREDVEHGGGLAHELGVAVEDD